MSRKQMSAILASLVAALAVLLVACSPALESTQGTSPLSTPAGVPTAAPATTTPITSELPTAPAVDEPTQEVTLPPEAAELVETIKRDLIGRLNLPEEAITMISVTAVDWPDASLGCPEPGKKYAQVVTPGYKIVLEANGQQYAYHSGGTDFILCTNQSAGPQPTAAGTATPVSVDPGATTYVEQARKDLAQRLGVAAEQVNILSAVAAQWRDSSLGCPKQGVAYLTVIVPGYLIKLEANGLTYEYHSGRNQIVTCDNPEAPLDNP